MNRIAPQQLLQDYERAGVVLIRQFLTAAEIAAVPHHQDNAYFCRTPPDMLTFWIAIDAVTEANGPVFFVTGSHKQGMQPTKPSGVRGNSIGLAGTPAIPPGAQFCGLLAPGAMPRSITARRFTTPPRTPPTSRTLACCSSVAEVTRRPIPRSRPPTPLQP